ncbi:unnamed protein product [Dibothriocephalus latus]|uniref:Uncharacterized protein n=1 Tax=Dibothriocephalus latus TaxID=60516 RepID=A0A3P7PGT5_DIBLA|nr:unnamed protein product [Dibothriocephalus latus]
MQGDVDSRPSGESTAAALNEDVTAETTENVQSGDEEKEVSQKPSEADSHTALPPTVSPSVRSHWRF